MYGISRISCQQDVMLVTFPEADQGAGSMAAFLTAFSDAGVNMDMISQSIPKGGSLGRNCPAYSTGSNP